MKVNVEILPHSRVKLTIELEPTEVRPYLEQTAKELSQQHPLKGFRPGAVPFDVLRSAIGDEALVERTLQKIVPKTYVEALMERDDVEAIGRPEVSALRVGIGEAWAYEAVVAMLPEVRLGEYKKIRATRNSIVVPPEEVEKELEVLQKMRASYLSVVRPVQKGDRVEVDIAASLDRIPLEQGSGRKQPLIVGEGHLIPGFEEQLVGMREGETKTFQLPFPAAHHQKDLQGKNVDFTVKIATVQQRILPALDDAFAQGLGKFSTVEELRAKLTENLQLEKNDKEQQRVQLELLKQVIETTTFGEFPDVLLDGEVEKMVAELADGLVSTGLTLDQYLQQIHKTLDEVREGFRPQALERVRSGLTLRAIARAERIEVDDAEVTGEVNAALQRFPNAEEAKKQVDIEELTNVAAALVRNRKVFALLEKFASV